MTSKRMEHEAIPDAGPLFVTGATGFIGVRLVEALVARGHRIRALSRRERPEPPPGMGWSDGGPLAHERVEIVRGDVTDLDSLRRGMEGCTHVFSLAGLAQNWAPRRAMYWEVNRQGMLNVFQAAREQGAARIVWTSTSVTFGPSPPGEVIDESTPRITPEFFTDYEHSKADAEADALRLAREGLPVVIVNPTRVFGPGHLHEGNAVAQLIDDYDRGLFPFLPAGGRHVGSWAFVDDVVEGHILAMVRGRIGERYILGGDLASLREFFRTVGQVTGRRRRQAPIPPFVPLGLSWLLKKRAEWFGVHPQITPGWVRTFVRDWAHSSDKAQRELGYQPTPLAEAIRITYEWLLRVRQERKR